MKKSILIVLAIMLSCMCTSNAQNTNANTKDTTKTEKKDEGPKIYRRGSVYTLVGYLRIFPYELGAFDYPPTDIINRVNANEQYGYNTWRIPTNAEITIIKANGYADQKEKYMTQESKSGRVLLVTDKEKADILRQRNVERQKREAAIEAQRRQQREEEEKRKQEELLQQKVDSLSQLTGFIDLGLPSGTLWSAQYEPCKYSFNMAMMLYGDAIPSKKQCKELINSCTWTAVKNKEGKTEGYIVTGKNGNSIYINRSFWSSTTDEFKMEKAWACFLSYHRYTIYHSNPHSSKPYPETKVKYYAAIDLLYKADHHAVKLIDHVENKSKNQYLANIPQNCELEFIDLGLSSGTKWANKDSQSDDRCHHVTYIEDLEEGIPTKEQWKELRKECNWVKNDYGYKIIGPNGNYILLPIYHQKTEYAYRLGRAIYPVEIQKHAKFMHPNEFFRKAKKSNSRPYDHRMILRKFQKNNEIVDRIQ